MIRAATSIALVLAGVAPSQAGVWQNQYLANTGGAHLIVVPYEERQTTEAFIDGENLRLRIGCLSDHSEDPERRSSSYIIIGNGSPIFGGTLELVAKFDDRPKIDLGKMHYAGGGYGATLLPQILAMFEGAEILTLIDQRSEFRVEFPLSGAWIAIQNIECMGDVK